MPGYADRFKRIDFPDLGPEVFVTIRNAKVMSPSKLRPEHIPTDANGNPVDEVEAELAMYRVIATLIRDWYVFDATSDEDDQPVLELPATGELVAKLPLGIINRIAEEMSSATNPH